MEQERARISRDLHDLLGQSLFLIGVKGESAARHVAATEPGGAEIRDVVRLAREALREMRRVVSGSRQPALEAELGAARGALDAAGIAVEIEQSLGSLPRALEALLGWTVREGVTNVIRHSRAATCRIVLMRECRHVRAEVVDDGPGRDAPGGGSGLDGLRGRLEASGGQLEVGPLPGGGFRLRVAVPHGGV